MSGTLEMPNKQEPVLLLDGSDAFLTIWLSSSAPGLLKLSDCLSCPAISDIVESALEKELFISFEQLET